MKKAKFGNCLRYPELHRPDFAGTGFAVLKTIKTMWQKINPVKLEVFENTRIQIHNSMQLVSAAARAYLPSMPGDEQAQLHWDSTNNYLESKTFGPEKNIHVSLDILKFILSVRKNSSLAEHLVLSGMSYPLAFGWLQVKLEKLGLDPEIFHDRSPYHLQNYGFNHSKELSVDDAAAEELSKYLSNASFVLSKVRKNYQQSGPLRVRPQQFDLSFELPIDSRVQGLVFGFCPGDESFIEPYYFIAFSSGTIQPELLPELPRGFWYSGDWTGAVLMTGDISSVDTERELAQVRTFFDDAAIACASMFKKV
jgi:hypothetical protein